jgi:3-oxoacyl-[acyl-carrier protein] reductase
MKDEHLILLGKTKSTLDPIFNSISSIHKGKIDCIACNVENQDEVSSSIAQINEITDNISLLINLAGVLHYGSVTKQNEDIFDNTMNVNIKLPYLLSVGLFENIKGEGGGKIINIGSTSSYSGYKNTVSYCTSKHALLGFSRALHDEWKDYGITVHCISCGSLNTGMSDQLSSQDKTTYIDASEFAKLIYDVSCYKGNMVIEEVKAIRRHVR